MDEFIISSTPQPADISALLDGVRGYDLVVIGALNAYNQEGQSTLVREALKSKVPTLVAAMRLPYDLMAFPEAPTYLCTYKHPRTVHAGAGENGIRPQCSKRPFAGDNSRLV